MASEDDTAYKQLFAYPEMVRDLLLGFVPGEWVRQLDLSSLERVNGSYVSDGGAQRHSDMVWRVRLAGEWIYIYLLLEFQSRSDPWNRRATLALTFSRVLITGLRAVCGK